MNKAITALRGMNDILPIDTPLWQRVEKTLRDSLHRFGYQEIRLPILEKTELFQRSIGNVTDIIEKEMYTFLDRNQESLSLRPEGTASCVRAGIEHGLFYHQIQRLWYMGPNFRYERPQKGRYRQFYHCGAELFGIQTPDADAELILLSANILQNLGLTDSISLQLNSLGSDTTRDHYRTVLVDYFSSHRTELDEDSLHRLSANPLRILDSKNPAMQPLISDAPKLIDYLDTDSQEHFRQLQDYLTHAGLAYTINPCLVRGLDYYSKTVFEWVTTDLGAQGTVCAGGRYDGLITQLGGHPTPALGFAIGLDRIILLLQQQSPPPPYHPDIYFIVENETASKLAIQLAQHVRNAYPTCSLIVHAGGGTLKSQFKKAHKSNATIALILGEQELEKDRISFKLLRESTPQISFPKTSLIEKLRDWM